MIGIQRTMWQAQRLLRERDSAAVRLSERRTAESTVATEGCPMTQATFAQVTLVVFASLFAVGRTAGADWPQWGGSGSRNNVADVRGLPRDWAPGKFDRRTGRLDPATSQNIKWSAPLGSASWGTPVIADGRVFVGTNNASGYLKRYPAEVDLGCLLCFREADGQFLWQFSAEKLATGRVHDWPFLGIASSPLVEEDRAWFVSNRGEVVCVDTQGFYDQEDDGPCLAEDVKLFELQQHGDGDDSVNRLIASLDRGDLPADLLAPFTKAGEPVQSPMEVRVDKKGRRWSVAAKVANATRQFTVAYSDRKLRVCKILGRGDLHEADVVWRFDMMKQLGSRQHNLATCSITSWKDVLFICTGNGVDERHTVLPAPDAPSFFAMDQHTGEVLWTSNLPGPNVHHGQWSAPAVGLLGGVPQVVFGGGDGWVYSFHAEQWNNGRPQLLWKFDTNAKDAVLVFGARGTRNEPIGPPVLHNSMVYVTTGQDPEHGEGLSCIWCIDAAKKLDGSDVSAHLVIDVHGKAVPPRRTANLQAWQEIQIWGGDWERDFDKGVVSDAFRRQFGYGSRTPLPPGMTVKALTPGAEWELNGGTGDTQETMYVWKRWRVNDAGEREAKYVAARRTGERIVDNPDSAVVWKYSTLDRDADGEIDFYEEMHRTISSVVIHEDLLFCPDFSGLLHCLDAKTGQRHWACDLFASCWGTPLIADGRLFVADEDGDVAIFDLSADPAKAGLIDGPKGPPFEPAKQIEMGRSIYCNPVAANGVLYLTLSNQLFAIEAQKKR